MVEAIRRVIGTETGLRFEFEIENCVSERRGLVWGRGIVYLGGEPVWCGTAEDGAEPLLVEWSWLDLLEFLGQYWPWLMLEESYPLPITPLSPLELQAEARRHWEDLPLHQVEEEEESLYRFQCRHDLAMAMKGIYLPSIFLMRQGRECQIAVAELSRTLACPFDEVRDALQEVGEFSAGRVKCSREPRALAALRQWQGQEAAMRDHWIAIRSGLPPETLRLIQGDAEPEGFWGLSATPSVDDTELLALARMSVAVTSAALQRELIAAVRAAEPAETPRLDSLSRTASTRLDTASPSFEQGHALAQCLRLELGFPETAPMNPERLLSQWGVGVYELELPAEAAGIDALAAWGRAHGPVILLNIGEGARPAHRHGRATTLAHEICHQLIDRAGALPFAEVLGGLSPRLPEQRARFRRGTAAAEGSGSGGGSWGTFG